MVPTPTQKEPLFALPQLPLQMVEGEVTGSIFNGYVNWIFMNLNSLETRPSGQPKNLYLGKHLKGLSYRFILLLCEFMPFTVRLSCFTSLYCMNLLCSCSLQVTYHFFHWKKGTPFADDQGIYNALTWWEQIDNGKQLTRNRKFLTVVPVVL